MNTLYAVVAFLVVVPLVLVPLFRVQPPLRETRGSLNQRRPLSRNQQTMYWRLTLAFPAPEFVVLAQVGLGSLMTAIGLARTTNYAESRAQFVVLDRSFTVLAIIELVEGSRAERHSPAETHLQRAGYRVVKYRAVPEKEKLRQDLQRVAGA
jgi:hypothetical protein